jgi:branched-subunit amino acid transport protein AzlD
MMQNFPANYSNGLPATTHPGDRTAGVLVMVFAAIAIPLHLFFSLPFRFFHMLGGHGHFSFLAAIFSTALLAALVYSGYEISRSQRNGFISGIVIGALCLFFHVILWPVALGTILYSAIRLGNSRGLR